MYIHIYIYIYIYMSAEPPDGQVGSAPTAPSWKAWTQSTTPGSRS